MNRRSFLASILACGVAPAAVGSGILMPVKPRIVTPRGGVNLVVDDVLYSPPIDWRLWQDMAMTIPAVRVGDPIAVIEQGCFVNGKPVLMTQPTAMHRPTWAGGHSLRGGHLILPTDPWSLPENWHMEIPGGLEFIGDNA